MSGAGPSAGAAPARCRQRDKGFAPSDRPGDWGGIPRSSAKRCCGFGTRPFLEGSAPRFRPPNWFTEVGLGAFRGSRRAMVLDCGPRNSQPGPLCSEFGDGSHGGGRGSSRIRSVRGTASGLGLFFLVGTGAFSRSNVEDASRIPRAHHPADASGNRRLPSSRVGGKTSERPHAPQKTPPPSGKPRRGTPFFTGIVVPVAGPVAVGRNEVAPRFLDFTRGKGASGTCATRAPGRSAKSKKEPHRAAHERGTRVGFQQNAPLKFGRGGPGSGAWPLERRVRRSARTGSWRGSPLFFQRHALDRRELEGQREPSKEKEVQQYMLAVKELRVLKRGHNAHGRRAVYSSGAGGRAGGGGRCNE